jgi:hypothetical protein
VKVTSPAKPLLPSNAICASLLCSPWATVIVEGVAVMLKLGPVGATTGIVS